MIQGTDEWRNARLGWVTASRIYDVMAKTKTGVSASRKNYMAEKVCEILTGEHQDSYTSPQMQWGIDHEYDARVLYGLKTFFEVDQAGFIPHPIIEKSGASPDGFVEEIGLIEIKCPNTATHIDTLLNKSIDYKYVLQMQFQMACTGRAWCDFVSFDPRLPDELQMVILRQKRDDELILKIEKEVIIFINELNDMIKKLMEASK